MSQRKRIQIKQVDVDKHARLKELLKSSQGARGTLVTTKRIQKAKRESDVAYWFCSLSLKIDSHHGDVKVDKTILDSALVASMGGADEVYYDDFPAAVAGGGLAIEETRESVLRASKNNVRQFLRIEIDQWCISLIHGSSAAKQRLYDELNVAARDKTFAMPWMFNGEWRRSLVEISESLISPSLLSCLPRVLSHLILDLLFCTSFSVLPNSLL